VVVVVVVVGCSCVHFMYVCPERIKHLFCLLVEGTNIDRP
jgi:hypothetical protein